MQFDPSGLFGKDLFGRPITFWCSGCNAEPAVTVVEAEFNGHWVPVNIGQECLTKVQEAGKIDE